MSRHPIELVGVDEALRRYNCVIDTEKPILAAVLRALHVMPLSTRACVHLLNEGGMVALAPPLRNVLGVGYHLEDEITRRVEHSRHDDFLFARLCDQCALSH